MVYHGLHLANWKDPPFLIGKSTISMAMFNSFLLVHQRVYHGFIVSWVQKMP